MVLDFRVQASDLSSLQRRLAQAGPRAMHAMAIQMAKDTEPYVPASGAAAGMSKRTQVDGDTIIYPGPYAKFLYYGKLMIDPNTGSSWAPEGATKVVTGIDLNISQAVHSKARSHWFAASKAQNLDKWIRVAGRVIRSGL